MKALKRGMAAIALICLLACTAAAAAELPEPTNEFFVNDFAGVISAADKQTMQRQGEALYQACGAQVVAVTVSSLDGMDIAEYGLRLARDWGIGSQEKNDGVLLLLSVGEPHVRIEVGSGLEGALPDSKAGRILDTYMIPHYTKDTFTVGLRETYNALINEVCLEYGLETDEDYQPIAEEDESGNIISSVLLIVIVAIMLIAMVFLGHRGGGFRGGFGGFGGFGGGGFSGGGFSGGGGGFSGGGGGFSGGGASR